jgi:hypothetical protein
MKPQEYNEIADKIWSDLKVIRDKKSHDYASDEDTLRNFKVTATILSQLGFQVKGEAIKASDVAMFFEVIKMCRRANLRGRNPENESVLDSVEDNVNYTCLQYACLLDEQKDYPVPPDKISVQEMAEECGMEFSDEDWVTGYTKWLQGKEMPLDPMESLKRIHEYMEGNGNVNLVKSSGDAPLTEGYHLPINPYGVIPVETPIEKKNWKLNGFWSFEPGKRYLINNMKHIFVNADEDGYFCFINARDEVASYRPDFLKCSVIEEA